MSLFFILNNLHFALEILGTLAFLMAAWLAFDAYFLRRNFLTASRGIGFLSLAVWQVIHAFGVSDSLILYSGFGFYILGLSLILLSFILERPAGRPNFEIILILPVLTATVFYINFASAILYLAITYLVFRQYKIEFKKSLQPLWFGFLFLFGGAVLSIFYGADSFGSLWIFGHILEIVGFGALMWWVWQYLQLRVREEMIAIFILAALLISIVVTFAFSVILVNQIEDATKVDLLINAKTLDLYLGRLKEEALAKTKFIAATSSFEDLMKKHDFIELEKKSAQYLENEKLGFLTVLDENGDVVLRAHALSQKEDNLAGEAAVAAALAGKNLVTIESSPAEKFSVRAASPLFSKGKVVGAIVGGFLLDNALVDNLKRITGLEMSILEKNTVTATTLLNPDGRTRSAGIKITDQEVISAVLGKGEEMVLRTKILARPAIAAYLPVKNADGKIIGMISSVKPQQEVLALANAANRLTLATVVILMLVLVLPIYLITKKLSDEV